MIFTLLAVFAGVTQALKNGDTICVEGFVMDKLCVDRGTLLDNPSVKTLEEPDKHSVHCLVDVGACRNSQYLILTDPPTEEADYTVGYAVTDATKSDLIDMARKVGMCDTCTGDGSLHVGFRIGAQGIVQDDSVDPPLIEFLKAEYVTMDVTYCNGNVDPNSGGAPVQVPVPEGDSPVQAPAEVPSNPATTPSSGAEVNKRADFLFWMAFLSWFLFFP